MDIVIQPIYEVEGSIGTGGYPPPMGDLPNTNVLVTISYAGTGCEGGGNQTTGWSGPDDDPDAIGDYVPTHLGYPWSRYFLQIISEKPANGSLFSGYDNLSWESYRDMKDGFWYCEAIKTFTYPLYVAHGDSKCTGFLLRNTALSGKLLRGTK